MHTHVHTHHHIGLRAAAQRGREDPIISCVICIVLVVQLCVIIIVVYFICLSIRYMHIILRVILCVSYSHISNHYDYRC